MQVFPRGQILKEGFEDLFTPPFSRFPCLYLVPVSKQGTKHLVPNTLVLPCQVLKYIATIQCYLTARAFHRETFLLDPLLASIAAEFALRQTIIQVMFKVFVRRMFVTIEVEELRMDKVNVHGDLANILRIISGQLEYFASLINVQTNIRAILLKIGLGHLFICCYVI